ncbi:hypothetical protein HPSA50_0617 [Helicobacter pylori SouthAfrica50]|uniref:Uncharacterized protein n=1 Tax=Helicobacter pylori SouthAfrica50 TaxID=1352357 RepID=T2S6K6_HELPX|nr:hypothetical protein HPSA50_0617 [Helicobacter pylori SouthAfrica50]
MGQDNKRNWVMDKTMIKILMSVALLSSLQAAELDEKIKKT